LLNVSTRNPPSGGYVKSLNLLARTAALAAALALGLLANGAQAQTTLRVAMTASDIPDVTGQPDQGFEGYRFVGYSLYDSQAE
jgi:peptide/nickel transport system substrate-binding protein